MSSPNPRRAAAVPAWLPLAIAVVLACAAALVSVPVLMGRGAPGQGKPIEAGGGFELALPAESPEGFGPVPDFTLTDQRGRTVTLDDLRGSPFALATIFTRCTGPCPAISERMSELQRVLEGTGARLVTVTVDPAHDSPEVLADYAESWGADPERWLFLTGSEAAVDALVLEGFHMAIARDPDEPPGQAVTHDTKLVAVDAEGERRGWYDQSEPAEIGRLTARMRFLAKEAAAE